MSEMENNPEVPASTRDEALFIHAVMQDKFLGAPRNSKADLTSLRKHEQVPQVPTQLERNPKLPTTIPQKPRNSPIHTRWGLFMLQCFPRNLTFPLGTGKGTWHPFWNPRSFPRYLCPLERNAEFPTTTQEEPCFPLLNSRWLSIMLLHQ